MHAGGTIAGDLRTRLGNEQLDSPVFFEGFTTQVIIDRAAGDIAEGKVDLGNGLDFLVKSFSSSGTYALPTSLPLSIEGGGVEALGANTTVTIAGDGAGIMAFGDGRIVNTGTIGPIDMSGSGLSAADIGIEFSLRAIEYNGAVEQQQIALLP
ncbi:MAG: hypothetical protein AB7E60_07600, partial [Sphingobium sp.]